MRCSLLLAFLALASCALPTRAEAQICDENICFDAVSRYGDLYLQTNDIDPAKATPDLFPVAVAPEDLGVVSPISLGGMDCSGSMSPPPSATGASWSGSMTCSAPTSTGNIIRLTISATWRYNTQTGEWSLEELDAKVTVVKFQNQMN